MYRSDKTMRDLLQDVPMNTEIEVIFLWEPLERYTVETDWEFDEETGEDVQVTRKTPNFPEIDAEYSFRGTVEEFFQRNQDYDDFMLDAEGAVKIWSDHWEVYEIRQQSVY